MEKNRVKLLDFFYFWCMTSKERAKQFTTYFMKNMPNASTELHYANAFELTVAVILSAQCTDKRVNSITKELFRVFPDSKSMANAEIEDIYALIKSCSYPMNKARHLSSMAKKVEIDFSGNIPNNLTDLQKLAGVGRKTANVIASVFFGIPTMPVDTHVFRVANRIGLTKKAKTPLQTELQLLKLFPKEHLNLAHHWLILHGRYMCKARNPTCQKCGIQSICSFYQNEKC